jgi:hypothetical protein
MKRIAFAAALLGSLSLEAGAASWEITSEAVKRECGACHMAFQPQFLPKRSWEVIMANLGDHFGEDASLTDPAVVLEITAYLVEHAGDAGAKPTSWVRKLPADSIPLRITELPRWVAEHNHEVSDRAWKKAGSKANCLACHRGADKGYYDDD